MYFFIVNPGTCCGKGEKVWIKLEKVLVKSGISYERYLTKGPKDAGCIAGMLSKNCREPRVIVVVGGDGTLNEVLDGLVLNELITLGYIPAGTGNDFARGTKIPRNPYRGLKQILSAKKGKLLDYGVLTAGSRADHRRFAVSTGIGLDGAVCRAVSKSGTGKLLKKLHLQRWCYALTGLRQLFLFEPSQGYIILDRVKKIEFNHVYLISAHIHPFEGGFRLAPAAEGSDGRLSVCVVNHESKRKLLLAFISALFRPKKFHEGIRLFECREAFFHVDRPMAVHADGEDCGNWFDLQAECIERNLRMII